MAATVASGPELAAERRVFLPRVSWETYERLLADDEGRRVPRLTFDQGELELVSPSTPHEEDAQTLSLLVEMVAEELGIDVRNVGSMTFKRADLQRGFEPDCSFYVEHEEQVRGKRQIDLVVDPPPDLIVEIEVTRPAIPKLPIYARMGVPEVWRCDGDRDPLLRLADGEYGEVARSAAFAPLTSDVLTRFLAASKSLRRRAWLRDLRSWARAQGETTATSS